MHGGGAGKLVIQHGSVQSSDSTITLSSGTLYYIWVEYEKSTGGSNGKLRLYVSTTSTKPSADITMTNGNDTDDQGLLYVGHPTSATQEFMVDQISVIGNATSVTTFP
jgi:hypothetical protein